MQKSDVGAGTEASFPQSQPSRIPSWISRMMDALFGYDFFISYSHFDQGRYAESLSKALRAHGSSVFLDRDEYHAGDDLSLQTRRRISMSTRVVVLASDVSVKSFWVQEEVSAVIKRGRRPIVVERDPSFATAADAEWLRKAAGDALRIRDHGPKPAPATVEALVRSFTATRRQIIRHRVFTATACTFLAAALSLGWLTFLQDRQRTLIRASELAANAQLYLDHSPYLAAKNAQDAVDSASISSTLETMSSVFRQVWPLERIWKLSAGRMMGFDFLADGQKLVSVGDKGVAQLVNLASGAIETQIRVDGAGLNRAVAVLDASDTIALGTDAGNLVSLTVPSLQVRGTIKVHSAAITSIHTIGNDRVITTGADGEITVVDVPRMRVVCHAQPFHLTTGPHKGIWAAAISRSGGLLATRGEEKLGSVGLWQIGQNTDQCPRLVSQIPPKDAPKEEPFKDSPTAIALSRRGDLLAIGDDEGGVALFAVRGGGKTTHKLETAGSSGEDSGHRVSSLAFSDDGKQLASATWGRSITIWDLPTDARGRAEYPMPLYRISPHGGEVWQLKYAADGRIVSIGWDGTLVVQNPAAVVDHVQIRRFTRTDGADASSTGSAFLAFWDSRKVVEIVESKSLVSIAKIETDLEPVEGAVSDDGKLIALGDDGGELRIYEIKSGKNLSLAEGIRLEKRVRTLSWVPQRSDLLLSTDFAGRFIAWRQVDNGTFQPEAVREIDGTVVDSLTMAPDGKLMAYVEQGSDAVVLRSLPRYLEMKRRPLPLGLIPTALAFGAQKEKIAIGASDGYLALYDIDGDKMSGALVGPKGDVRSIAFNKSGALVAASDEAGSVYVWRTETGQRIARLDMADPDTNARTLGITKMTFSDTEDVLTLSSDSGVAQLWHLQEASMRQRLGELVERYRAAEPLK